MASVQNNKIMPPRYMWFNLGQLIYPKKKHVAARTYVSRCCVIMSDSSRVS